MEKLNKLLQNNNELGYFLEEKYHQYAAKWFIDSSKTSDFLIDDMKVVNAERLIPPCDISIDMDTGVVSITGTFKGWYAEDEL